MLKKIAGLVKFTDKLGERAREQEILKQILFCEIYNNFRFPFHQEETGNGEKISIYDRAPIVDVGLSLIRNTVDTLTAFVFGEGKFPDVDTVNHDLRTTLLDLVMESKLFNVMQEAMLYGSLGSVAIQVWISDENRIHFKVYPTQFLTPEWDHDDPDELETITEKYIVTAQDLRNLGYTLDEKKVSDFDEFFFQRVWDENAETWYIPWPTTVDPNEFTPQIDTQRTVIHNLGIMPFVWIKNLKGGNGIDGSCTFKNAIKACIEMDFLVSQADRGLKYMADPLLVVSGANDPTGEILKGPATGLSLDRDGRAELLEIKGSSYGTIIEQVKQLRDHALEAMGGNRSTPERMHVMQSGTALQQLWQPTLLLAGDLRNSYGENGFLKLLKLVLQIGATRPLRIKGKLVAPTNPDENISLRWGPYFEPNVLDQQNIVMTLRNMREGGLISRQSAIKFLSNEFGIESVDAEVSLIVQDEAEQDAREIKLAAQTQVRTNQN